MARRRRLVVALSLVAVVFLGSRLVDGGSSGSARQTAAARRAPTTTAPPAAPAPLLRPGSDASVLPGPILIADRGNDRLVEVDPHGRVVWEFPRPGDLARGDAFRSPGGAFFSADGRFVVASEEDESVITVIDVAAHRIVWRYGKPGVAGSAPGRLSSPVDAMLLRDGQVLVADAKNCRLLLVPFKGRAPSRVFGDGRCSHAPPSSFGSPAGAFPMRNGDLVVTEIEGSWVDEMSLSGEVVSSTRVPRVAHPSGTNELAPGVFLTVDSSSPGSVVVFDGRGHVRWRFAPRGPDALNRPSIALPLPNGDILATDDYGSRVVVVDPRTNTIVWQYGQTGRPGARPGYLSLPAGVDLVPPHQLLRPPPSPVGTNSRP